MIQTVVVEIKLKSNLIVNLFMNHIEKKSLFIINHAITKFISHLCINYLPKKELIK